MKVYKYSHTISTKCHYQIEKSNIGVSVIVINFRFILIKIIINKIIRIVTCSPWQRVNK